MNSTKLKMILAFSSYMKAKDFSMKFEQVTYDPSNYLKML